MQVTCDPLGPATAWDIRALLAARRGEERLAAGKRPFDDAHPLVTAKRAGCLQRDAAAVRIRSPVPLPNNRLRHLGRQALIWKNPRLPYAVWLNAATLTKPGMCIHTRPARV